MRYGAFALRRGAFGDQGIVQTRLPSGELPKAKCQAMLELAALDPVRAFSP